MTNILHWLLQMVDSVDWFWRDIIAATAIALETTIGLGVIIPGDTVVVVAATGVTGPLDFVGLYLCVLAGSLLGETGGYFIGKAFGTRLQNSALGRRIGEKNWALANSFIVARGGVAVALSRFLPVLHSLVPVTVGIAGMPFKIFIRWMTGACALWALAYTSLGWLLRGSYESVLSKLKYGDWLFVALALIVAFGFTRFKSALQRSADKLIAEGEEAAEIASLETEEGLE
jgi:membrane-associated protein